MTIRLIKVPNRLSEFRKNKGLRQQEVATHLGLKSTDRISKWEKGVLYPHVVNFLKLVKLYEINPFEVYTSTNLLVQPLQEQKN